MGNCPGWRLFCTQHPCHDILLGIRCVANLTRAKSSNLAPSSFLCFCHHSKAFESDARGSGVQTPVSLQHAHRCGKVPLPVMATSLWYIEIYFKSCRGQRPAAWKLHLPACATLYFQATNTPVLLFKIGKASLRATTKIAL